jgi:hypothetical protein
MQIILHPTGTPGKESLTGLYDRAISEGVELFIITAYLTGWKPKSVLRNDCKELSFIVGTDFGITTKEACRSVLNWLPKTMKNDFLAADGVSGFHPKLVLWKNRNAEYNIVLGSSNLTQAAFSTNYEANVYSTISEEQYDAIKDWIYSVRLLCSPVSEDWIKEYKEATRPAAHKTGRKGPVISLDLPSGKDIDLAVKRRREQQKAFTKIGPQLLSPIENCAEGKISNVDFYESMMALWGSHDSRFQGRGFEISGKHSAWKQVCTSISRLLAKAPILSLGAMDNLVRKEIDVLASAENPNRGAWLSEMLCHFFPERYPILNNPVKAWLKHNKYKSPSNASEGAKFIDLSVKLRNALKTNTANSARDLAELDHAIWKWYANQLGKE